MDPFWQRDGITLYCGDALRVLQALPDASVHCCGTSPPYFALRDYGHDGQIGLEDTPQEYIARLVEVFDQVWRVLRPDGVLWLNLGDVYCANQPGGRTGSTLAKGGKQTLHSRKGRSKRTGAASANIKPKDLMGLPWRLAFALQDRGWYLRSEVIWCLSGGAWLYVRCAGGDRPIMVKDLVRGYKPGVQVWNGERWTRVLGWSETQDRAERLELVLRSGERIGCTAGHQWPTRRGNVAARDLRVGDVIRSVRLPEPDGAVMPPYLTTDVLWLAGLYLAEGSRSKRTIQLRLHIDEARWLDRIRAAASHLGGSCAHYVVGEKELAVNLCGRVLNATIDTFIAGSSAHDKHLAGAAWDLPDSALRYLIDGYLDGDGSYEEHNRRWRLGFCRNYLLERDLRVAAARLGATLTLVPTFGTDFANRSPRRLPKFRGEWRWQRSGHHNERDRGEVVQIRASRARHFWDIGVADPPHLFALASGVLSHNSRPNALPESVRDRPTKAHETVFLLTRNDRYFYDPDGWREPVSAESVARAKRNRFGGKYQDTTGEEHGAIKRGANYGPDGDIEKIAPSGGRNIRSVWSIPTEPCPYPHFAVFPRELAARFILLGTSEKGCCAECGAPWSRVVGHPCAECGESVPAHAKECPECGHRNANWREHRGGDVSQRVDPHLPGRHAPRLPGGFTNTQLALDWEPTCMCRVLRCSACGWNETVRGMKGTTLLVGVCPDCDRKLQSELPAVEPCTVLDPFVGSGTTLLVAEELLRRGVGIEINPDNCEIVKKRCGPQRSLFVSAPSKP